MNIEQFKQVIVDYADEKKYQHPVFEEKVDEEGNDIVIIKFDKTILFPDRPQEKQGIFSSMLDYSSAVDFDKEVKQQHIATMKACFEKIIPGVVHDVRIQKEKGINLHFLNFKKESKKVRGNDLGEQEASIRVRLLKSTVEKMDEVAVRTFALAMDCVAATTDFDPNIKVTEEMSNFRHFLGLKEQYPWGYAQANAIISHPNIQSGFVANTLNGIGVTAGVIIAVLAAFGEAKSSLKSQGKAYKHAGEGKFLQAGLDHHRAKWEMRMAGEALKGGALIAADALGDGQSSGLSVQESASSFGLATKSTLKFKEDANGIEQHFGPQYQTYPNYNSYQGNPQQIYNKGWPQYQYQ